MPRQHRTPESPSTSINRYLQRLRRRADALAEGAPPSPEAAAAGPLSIATPRRVAAPAPSRLIDRLPTVHRKAVWSTAWL